MLLETVVLPRAHKGGFLQFSQAVVAQEGIPAAIPSLFPLREPLLWEGSDIAW